MSILSKLMGTAQGTAARGKSTSRGTAAGRRGMGSAGGGTGRSTFRGFSRQGTPGTGRRAAGRGGAPAASGGLGKIIGSLTGRR